MTTATLFNGSYKVQSGRDLPPAPANMRRIVIVGGGTAGWLYSAWMERKSIVPGVREQVIGRGYPIFSWYAIMAGMGIFPEADALRPPSRQEARYSMAEIDNLLERSVRNFPDHAEALARIAPRRTDESSQIYFW